MKDNNDSKQKISRYDYGSDFACPDCGKTSKDGAYDAGNGFCKVCAPNH